MCACVSVYVWYDSSIYTYRFHLPQSIPGVPRLAHHGASRSARNVDLKHVGNICCDHVLIKCSETPRLFLTLLSIYLTWLEFCVGRCCKMLQDVGRCCKMLHDVGRCCKMLQYVARCWKMLEDVGRSESFSVGSKHAWSGIGPGYNPRLPSTFQNITVCRPKVPAWEL